MDQGGSRTRKRFSTVLERATRGSEGFGSADFGPITQAKEMVSLQVQHKQGPESECTVEVRKVGHHVTNTGSRKGGYRAVPGRVVHTPGAARVVRGIQRASAGTFQHARSAVGLRG